MLCKDTVIVAAKRTPIGSHLGSLSQVPATHLGATAIRAAVDASGINPEKIGQVIMGMVLQGGVGQAPARQAMIYAVLPSFIPATTVHKVCGSGMEAVIAGARMIGNGIAHVFAQRGIPVVLIDTQQKFLDIALQIIKANAGRQVSKGVISSIQFDLLMKNITTTTELFRIAGCQLIIEAITEKISGKIAFYEQLHKANGLITLNTILASNTSSISIETLADHCQFPGNFIGMHFMNPAPMMKLVEVVRGPKTAADTVRLVTDLAEILGKVPVVANNWPSFVVNYLLMPPINAACQLLEKGVCDISGIDTAMRLGAGHPMGPLTLGDLIGLDVCLAIMEVLHEKLGDAFKPASLLEKMVQKSCLGQKTKKGFYDYSVTQPKSVDLSQFLN